jgi:arylsulfatase A-like enzyme
MPLARQLLRDEPLALAQWRAARGVGGRKLRDSRREAIAAIGRAKRRANPSSRSSGSAPRTSLTAGCPQDLSLYDDLPARYSKPVKLTSNETGGQVTRPQGEVLRERYAEITAMDRAIGNLRKHLAASGLRENTLLFYCGDNGTSPDAALGFPHRGAKGPDL